MAGCLGRVKPKKKKKACFLHFQPHHMKSKVLFVLCFFILQVLSSIIVNQSLSLHPFVGFGSDNSFPTFSLSFM